MTRFLEKTPISVIFAIYLVIWVSASLYFDMHGDMADQYYWSRDLMVGYEQAPMVAWVGRLLTFFAPTSIPLMKAMSVVFFAFVLWMAFLTCRYIYGERTARLYLVMLMLTPYFSAGSLFYSVNIVALLFVVFGIWCVAALIKTANPIWLLALAIVAGLGGLSKYTYVLFCLSVAVWLVLDRDMRYVWRSYQLYLVPIVVLIVFSPVLYTEWQTDFASFTHHLRKGATDKLLTIDRSVGFLAGGLFLFSPVFCVLAWKYLFQRKLMMGAKSSERFLLALVVVPIAFFTLKGLRSSVMDPNWADLSYLALYMLLARYLVTFDRGYIARIYRYASLILLGVSVLVMGYFSGLHRLIYDEDSRLFGTSKKIGYQSYSIVAKLETADSIEELVKSKNGGIVPRYVITTHYMLGGDFGIYMRSQPKVFTYGRAWRNVWVNEQEMRESDFLLVCEVGNCEEGQGFIKSYFGRNSPIYLGKADTIYDDRLIREFEVYIYKK